MITNVSCFSYSIIVALILSHSCLIFRATCDNTNKSERRALEIIIGGGEPYPSPENQDCPPPPPPEICPPPPPPPPEICPPPPPPPLPPPTPKKPPPPPQVPSFFPPGFAANLIRDYHTIQEFRKTVIPNDITRQWNSYNVCTYRGFICDRRPDRPEKLSTAVVNFNGFNLRGRPKLQLKKLLDDLVDLAIFHINTNFFNGFVPNDIGVDKINFLYELDLSNNKLSGGFPTSTLAAKNLTFLDIRYNYFSGPVPPEAFTLDLDVLYLNNNQFDSSLPENIGKTPAIYLTLANNKFTGPIPSSFGYAKNLREVLFLNNRLTGCLPYEIGFLSKMILFDASFNNLTGPIPHSFACLAKLGILNLEKNKFFGPVPEMLCKLPNLERLKLSRNYFTQVGPECMKLIAKKTLDVSQNCVLGLPNQRDPMECKEFFSTPKSCPNEKSLTLIPCMKSGYSYLNSNNKVAHHHEEMVAASAPKSYDALSPDYKLRF